MDMNKGISAMQSKVGKSTYSMYGSRYYTDGTADCSGAVYYALRNGGGYDFGYIPSTETLHAYMRNNGFSLIAENKDFPMQRGDVIIWGKQGFSGGANGHTGIKKKEWQECTQFIGYQVNQEKVMTLITSTGLATNILQTQTV